MNRRTIISAPTGAPSACASEDVRAAVRAATRARTLPRPSQFDAFAASGIGLDLEGGAHVVATEALRRQTRRERVRGAILAVAFFAAWYVPQFAVWMLGVAR